MQLCLIAKFVKFHMLNCRWAADLSFQCYIKTNTNKYVQITEDSLEEGIALSVVTEAIVSVTEKSSDDTSKEVF